MLLPSPPPVQVPAELRESFDRNDADDRLLEQWKDEHWRAWTEETAAAERTRVLHRQLTSRALPMVYLEDLKLGMSASLTHTVTEQDIELFGQATGDRNPVHFDEEYARKTVFRGRVAHGALSIGFISALLPPKLDSRSSRAVW